MTAVAARIVPIAMSAGRPRSSPALVLGSAPTLARGVGVGDGLATAGRRTATGFPCASTAIRTQALPASALSGRASIAWFGRGLTASRGIVKKAVVVVTLSAQPINETGALCHAAMPFGAGSGAGGLTFSTASPQMQISWPSWGRAAPPMTSRRGSCVPSRRIGESGGCAGVNEVTLPQTATRGTRA